MRRSQSHFQYPNKVKSTPYKHVIESLPKQNPWPRRLCLRNPPYSNRKQASRRHVASLYGRRASGHWKPLWNNAHMADSRHERESDVHSALESSRNRFDRISDKETRHTIVPDCKASPHLHFIFSVNSLSACPLFTHRSKPPTKPIREYLSTCIAKRHTLYRQYRWRDSVGENSQAQEGVRICIDGKGRRHKRQKIKNTSFVGIKVRFFRQKF